MGKVFEVVAPDIAAFIEKQRMFFVATAPSGDEGHVNPFLRRLVHAARASTSCGYSLPKYSYEDSSAE